MNETNRYFQKIRKDPQSLQAFFEQMPKGGDLHHHALGAIWAEDVLEVAVEMELWIDLKTGQLDSIPAKAWYAASEVKQNQEFYNQIIDHWSVRNFKRGASAAPQHFFDIFPKIEAVFVENEVYWLKKIACTAAKEHISYIETLIEVPLERNRVSNWAMDYEQWTESPQEVDLDHFYEYLIGRGIEAASDRLGAEVANWQKEVDALEEAAQIGFQIYAIRTYSAAEVFAQLALCFIAAEKTEEVLGVNLVAPEHHPTSLKDYRLHMQFCAYLSKRFPKVKLALHAGELTDQLVGEEDLSFHIDLALQKAGALRIGHGVDLLEEKATAEILDKMKKDDILLEVLLGSNDFILNVSAEQHPFMEYWKAGLPIAIATDDPALLRISLADQYVKAAQAFPQLGYADFKILIHNSLEYAFLPEKRKSLLKDQLTADLIQFEQSFLS